MSADVAGLLLAAGQGRRMGQPKALLELHGQMAVCRSLDVLAEGGCTPLVVVVGAEADQVAAVAAACHPDVTVVRNDAWAEGMGTSFCSGVRHVQHALPDATGVLVHLVDQPLITPAVIAALIAARSDAVRTGESTRERAWAASYGGRRRTPVLFAADVLDEVVADIEGDQERDRAARVWLSANPDRTAMVDCGHLGAPDDLDTPDDLTTYLAATPPPGTSDVA